MKTLKQLLFMAFVLLFAVQLSAQRKYNYESVPNDPLNARIYTLDNGLKVYMSVYKETPRIQTNLHCPKGRW